MGTTIDDWPGAVFCTVEVSPFLDSKDPKTSRAQEERGPYVQAAFSSTLSQYCSWSYLEFQVCMDEIPSPFHSDIMSAYKQRMGNGLLLLNLSSLVTSHQTI